MDFCERFAFFKALREGSHSLSWGVMQCQDFIFLTHSHCNFSRENNITTKVVEWKRSQVSFWIKGLGATSYCPPTNFLSVVLEPK